MTSKHFNLFLFLEIFALTTFRGSAQGTFQNLDFEQANPVFVTGSPYYPYVVTAASAFPFWTVSEGTVQQTQVFYNTYTAGANAVELFGNNDPFAAPPVAPIDGNYSANLQGTAQSVSISQTGLIPAGTQSLYFEAQGNLSFPPGILEVLIGGQNVPYSAIGTGPNYTLYAANISAWAGQTEQLTFSALQDLSYPNNWELDDISFSVNPVPEPSAFMLTGIGGMVFGLLRCARFKK